MAQRDGRRGDAGLSDELVVNDVSVDFNGIKAIRNVSLRVEPGEIVGLIGPNGAGKSTLVNIITGYVKPGTGSVLLGGRNRVGLKPHLTARAGLARTFQNVRLFGRLTVRENVESAAYVSMKRRAAKVHSRAVLERLGLTGVAELAANSLPYGAERRVALARALALSPKFLLMDEPAAGLDEAETHELANVIREIKRDLGCGQLIIEHDIEFIMSLCDRIYVLAQGQLIATGSPDQVRRDPKVISSYLGALA